ncbi:GlcG/HbpS family heme-binding protein [Vibrio sp. SCSIO 43137]|uniref:GlcG/HbpS family heme-binding protein n=1 Tax=Vibrio sp. SCSIO 43137 TaxID=3021011 RepID=UPI002307D8DD|nr:heme-binding protein [Vibrio sp. SCSIO 43137]WCE32061.1 heme-binding protein [Vibrio sp. SCSIO 43137]
MVVTDTSLSWQSALLIAQASIEYAELNKLKVCVSVLDRHGHPLAQLRVNNTAFPCTQISADKAYTAVSFGFSTQEWNERLKHKPSLLQGLSQQKRMVLFGGGLPVCSEGELLGAVGVSGASEEQDAACAKAGVEAFLKYADNHYCPSE